METKISSDLLLIQLNELLAGNLSSCVDFIAEKAKAEAIVDLQHKTASHLELLHQEMIEMLDRSDLKLAKMEEMRATFDRIYGEYLENENELKKILLTLNASFATEKNMNKNFFFEDSTQALKRIIEASSIQDKKIIQLNETFWAVET